MFDSRYVWMSLDVVNFGKNWRATKDDRQDIHAENKNDKESLKNTGERPTPTNYALITVVCEILFLSLKNNWQYITDDC